MVSSSYRKIKIFGGGGRILRNLTQEGMIIDLNDAVIGHFSKLTGVGM